MSAEGFDVVLRSNVNVQIESVPAESDYTIKMRLINTGSKVWENCKLKYVSGVKLFDDYTLPTVQTGTDCKLEIKARAPKYDEAAPDFVAVYQLCNADGLPFPSFISGDGCLTFTGTVEKPGFFTRLGHWMSGNSDDDDKTDKNADNGTKPPKKPRDTGRRGRGARSGRMMARMLHPVNGRQMFDPLDHDGTAAAPSVRVTPALLKAMRLRESELRLLPANQQRLIEESVIDVTTELQQQVATEFGFEDVEAGIRMLLTAEEHFPEHAQELKDVSHWRKYNRAQPGSLQVGDDVRQVPVAHLNGTLTTLSSYLPDDDTKPCIVAAGSYS
eukprot:TRINITY_DN11232_c0_g1_i1.p1 TRINITY_DN11232_c0_g1~~TRINITY_DN11232_c0_g1_i1.p1  ORF type:complete len:329 (+),score=97.16 TRINITY_DN11232_c0_g1_i1:117-1103(+)